eukprot:SAG22_NODE_857_length_6837_cov_22.929059_10_plen_57_part_00
MTYTIIFNSAETYVNVKDMELWKAVQIVEGDIECLEQEWVEAWQWLIDEGRFRSSS